METLLAEIREELLHGTQTGVYVAAVGDLPLGIPRDVGSLQLIDGAFVSARPGEAVKFRVCVRVEFVCTFRQIARERITDIQGWTPLLAAVSRG